MACTPGDGFGWRRRRRRHPQQEEKDEEAEEEDELEGCADKNGALDVGGNRLVVSMGRWHLSSSSEILEDADLLEELKDYPHLLDEGEQSLDLAEVQDLDCAGDTEPRSPPSENGEHLEDDGNPEDVGPVSYWQPQRERQLALTEEDQDGASSEELETQRRVWNAGSEGETYPELSYEVQYGSEYSASPEALRDPLALYRPGKSYSFISDGGEESEHSNFSPSPSRPPLECGRLKIEVFETHSLLGGSLESPQEMEFSSPSGRSPESCTFSSPVGSTRWSQSFLGHLSVEDLQNVPSIDAETFPESSCTENPGKPMGTVVKVANAAEHCPLIATKPKERRSDTVGRTEISTRLRAQADRQPERARKLKADVPQGLPSKFTRQSRSLSPQGRRATRKKTDRSSSSEADQANRPTPVTNDASRYGRGQLNYPLPDLSKVEPRVRFPKDPQHYHPPRGKTLPARSNEFVKPVVFKSPAEIVREVLLSSGEGPPQKCLTPTISVIPEELKSPRQATELVHQLQEDYRKLLTKYAEAENTIDRLRLGTKVRLYADAPKPSHGIHMGTVSQGSKVMTFNIPQGRVAEVSGSPAPVPDTAWHEGLLVQQATFSPLPNSTVSGVPGADGHTSTDKAVLEGRSTQVLANQARTFQRQVELLEELIQMGRLTPQDQLKGFSRLKEAQGALEQAYLQARDEHRKLQEPTGAPGDFDPDRAVEGEIFRLEMRLQELKERIEQASQTQQAPGSDSETTASPSSLPARASETQMRSPTPSIQAPIPAVRTPYPEAPIPKDSRCQVQVGVEVSSVSDETEEDGEGLPEPLWRKQLQTEKDFDCLLDCYSSFKSLPEALSWEQLNLEGQGLGPEEVDGAAAEDAGTQNDSHGVVAKVNGITCNASLQASPEREPPALLPRKPQQPPCQIGHVPTGHVPSGGSSENSRSSATAPKATSGRKQEQLSRRSSMASVAGSSISEHAAQKSLQKTSTALPEEVRIVSPETDSGFVGSEASRVSPLAQPPKHRSSHARLSSSGGALEENMRSSRRSKKGSVLPHGCLAPRSHGVVAKPVLPDDHAATAILQPAAHPRKEPEAMEPLVADAAPEGAARRRRLASGSSFHLGSPPKWANSIASELEPDTDSADSDSEDHGGSDACKSPPSEMRCSPSSSMSLSPARTRCYNLLSSRLERDQAIAALQNEVSQLRRSLEETLHRPQGSPKRSLSPHGSRAREPSQGSGAFFSKSGNPKGKTVGETLAKSEDPAPAVKPGKWTKRASLSQDGTPLDLTPSESNSSVPKPQEGKHRNVSASKTKPPKQPILQGPYTGTRYSFLTPEPQKPKARRGSTSCPSCQDDPLRPGEESMLEHDAKGAAGTLPPRNSLGPSQHSTQRKTAPSQHSTQRKTAPCLLCKGMGSPRSKVVHGVDHGTEDASAQGKPSNRQQPQQPGHWYLAFPPPSAASVGYITAVPLTPHHPSPVMYCSAPAPTSTSTPAGLPIYISPGHQATELRTWASSGQPRDHLCRSLMFDRDSRCDLNWSLSRAVKAAEGLKLTTKRMSRSLTSELNRARSLRGSCLF